MLFKEAIEPSTLELIKSLQPQPYIKEFFWWEERACTYYGHRKSIDVDLFTNVQFDADVLLEKLINDFSFQLTYTANQTLKGIISGVKVDFITFLTMLWLVVSGWKLVVNFSPIFKYQ